MENRLGTQKISKLLLSFSIPAVTGMLVQALYNIVDSFFVGQYVNSTALGATGLVMPMMNIFMGFSMLFGIGTSALISIRMGEKKNHEAEGILTNGFIMLIFTGVAISVLGTIFVEPILQITGGAASADQKAYAIQYAQIIAGGACLQLLGFGLNHSIRAQGSPKIAMYTMIIGAVANTLLDALFVIVFEWGVRGAAIATIISQGISAVWVVLYFIYGKTNIKLNLRKHKFDFKVVGKIMSIGSSAFALQIAASVVVSLLNNGLMTYGKQLLTDSGIEGTLESIQDLGSSVALAGYRIISSLTMFVLMPVFGTNQGAQPILGFNYGAKQYDRVKKTYRLAVSAATIWVVFCFVMIMLFPQACIGLFVKPDSNYNYLLSFGTTAIRIALLALPVVGFQVISSSYFQAVGKPHKALVLSTSRQVLFLIPLVYIMPKIFVNIFGPSQGVNGLMWALFTADLLASVVTGLMIFFEMRKLGRKHQESVDA